MVKTHNKVDLQGYVGKFVKLPIRRGDPARFDMMTSERLNTTDGEVITTHDWHTIQTPDIGLVRESVKPGVLVRVIGRLTTRRVKTGKVVEVVARELELVDSYKD